MSFIIRTERGCGKRDLNSSGSVWTLLSGESLNGGVFQRGYEELLTRVLCSPATLAGWLAQSLNVSKIRFSRFIEIEQGHGI